jgi:hypothetical protein
MKLSKRAIVKSSGVLKYPEPFFQKTWDLVSGSLRELYYFGRKYGYESLQKYLKENPKVFNLDFEFSLSDIPGYEKFNTKELSKEKAISIIAKDIKLTADFEGSIWLLTLNIRPMDLLRDFYSFMKEKMTGLKHELTHASQDAFSLNWFSDEEKVSRNIPKHMDLSSPEPEDFYEYIASPIEFDPQIITVVGLFLSKYGYGFDSQDVNNFISTFTFFTTVKKKSERLFQLAVKKFYQLLKEESSKVNFTENVNKKESSMKLSKRAQNVDMTAEFQKIMKAEQTFEGAMKKCIGIMGPIIRTLHSSEDGRAFILILEQAKKDMNLVLNKYYAQKSIPAPGALPDYMGETQANSKEGWFNEAINKLHACKTFLADAANYAKSSPNTKGLMGYIQPIINTINITTDKCVALRNKINPADDDGIVNDNPSSQIPEDASDLFYKIFDIKSRISKLEKKKELNVKSVTVDFSSILKEIDQNWSNLNTVIEELYNLYSDSYPNRRINDDMVVAKKSYNLLNNKTASRSQRLHKSADKEKPLTDDIDTELTDTPFGVAEKITSEKKESGQPIFPKGLYNIKEWDGSTDVVYLVPIVTEDNFAGYRMTYPDGETNEISSSYAEELVVSPLSTVEAELRQVLKKFSNKETRRTNMKLSKRAGMMKKSIESDQFSISKYIADTKHYKGFLLRMKKDLFEILNASTGPRSWQDENISNLKQAFENLDEGFDNLAYELQSFRLGAPTGSWPNFLPSAEEYESIEDDAGGEEDDLL